MNKVTVRYEDGLNADLSDPAEAAAYLNAALEEGRWEVFLLALRDVAEAIGIGRIARGTHLNRENILRMLSATGSLSFQVSTLCCTALACDWLLRSNEPVRVSVPPDERDAANEVLQRKLSAGSPPVGAGSPGLPSRCAFKE